MAAAPFLVGRFIEPAVAPRAAVWIYFALLVSLVSMVLGLSMFLFLFLAPHAAIGGLGAGCYHGKYCLHGLPAWAQFTLWLSVTGFIGWVVLRMGWVLAGAIRAGRRVRRAALFEGKAVAADGGSCPVLKIPDGSILACTVGVLRPFILVTDGLYDSLPPEELQVVLAHEQAHAQSRDNLVLLLARMIYKALFFLPGASKADAGMRRSLEIAADESAARRSGDELLVATSVSHVARLVFDSARPRSLGATVAAAFAHGELIVERVQHLVKERSAPSRRRLLCGVAALTLVVVVFGASFYAVTGNSLTDNPRSTACTEIAWR